jgi:hypothetical protein
MVCSSSPLLIRFIVLRVGNCDGSPLLPHVRFLSFLMAPMSHALQRNPSTLSNTVVSSIAPGALRLTRSLLPTPPVL